MSSITKEDLVAGTLKGRLVFEMSKYEFKASIPALVEAGCIVVNTCGAYEENPVYRRFDMTNVSGMQIGYFTWQEHTWQNSMTMFYKTGSEEDLFLTSRASYVRLLRGEYT